MAGSKKSKKRNEKLELKPFPLLPPQALHVPLTVLLTVQLAVMSASTSGAGGWITCVLGHGQWVWLNWGRAVSCCARPGGNSPLDGRRGTWGRSHQWYCWQVSRVPAQSRAGEWPAEQQWCLLTADRAGADRPTGVPTGSDSSTARTSCSSLRPSRRPSTSRRAPTPRARQRARTQTKQTRMLTGGMRVAPEGEGLRYFAYRRRGGT